MSYGAGVRPTKTVAGAALTAVLALAALPGLAGSRSLSTAQDLDAAAFQSVNVGVWPSRPPVVGGPLDPGSRSDGFIDAGDSFQEPGQTRTTPSRPAVRPPASKSTRAWKDPLYTLTGYASFYDNGTTAMRLPRGTIVVICAAGGCLERVVNDYGPSIEIRIVDMYRPDFFAICACGWWTGTMEVTVKVY